MRYYNAPELAVRLLLAAIVRTMKPFSAFPVAGVLALGLSACVSKTYPVAVGDAPALSVHASYEEKIPGRYALYVEAKELKRVLKFSRGCAEHNYPTDAQAAFESSSLQTLKHLVEHMELVSEPIMRSELEARGYDGMILLEVEDLDTVLVIIPGTWTGSALAGAKLSVNMSVEGRDKRLLGGFAAGADEDQVEMGRYCAKSEMAVGRAIEGAMELVLKRLAVLLSNMTEILKQEAPPSAVPDSPFGA